MIVLAAETSTQLGSVAVGRDGVVLAELSSDTPKSHSEEIHSLISSCLIRANLSLGDVDIFAVGIGPGGFTGIRVAVNAIRSLAYALDKPVFGLDSLSLLSLQTKDPVVCMINAFKDMIFYSYQQQGTVLAPAKSVSLQDFEMEIEKLGASDPIAVGDAYSVYQSRFSDKLKSKLRRDSSLSDFPKASLLVRAASDNKFLGSTKAWNLVFPLYLRGSGAEENLKG